MSTPRLEVMREALAAVVRLNDALERDLIAQDEHGRRVALIREWLAAHNIGMGRVEFPRFRGQGLIRRLALQVRPAG